MSHRLGLIGLAVMGQNLALNIADHGFPIAVWNRSHEKTLHTQQRAKDEKVKATLTGFEKIEEFVASIQRPRAIIILVQAGRPVDAVIASLSALLEPGDIIVDGGNEWFENTERRGKELKEKGIMYMGMGVSGGEDGARYGPSLMPGGPKEAYEHLKPVLTAIAAQVDDGPCVTYIGEGGAGNYVKMIHNGIEYGDMQLIAEAYDILKNVGGLSNDELAATFAEWNRGELSSFLIEITARIFTKKDDSGFIVDAILDKTGQKGTGRMTIQEAAELGVAASTISAALDARNLSALLEERRVASGILQGPKDDTPVDKEKLIKDVKMGLYAAKICSYSQGMNLIRSAAKAHGWHLDLGAIARIWKGGCIIRAVFLDRIKAAYDRRPDLPNLLIDPEFAAEMNERHNSLRQVAMLAISKGVSVGAFSASLFYYDSYRRERLPANLTQAQRDFFGAHTYQRTDKEGVFHTEWAQ